MCAMNCELELHQQRGKTLQALLVSNTVQATLVSNKLQALLVRSVVLLLLRFTA